MFDIYFIAYNEHSVYFRLTSYDSFAKRMCFLDTYISTKK